MVDHLVIGGGPAGAIAAIKLAEAGRQVTLVEREAGPHHKVCGEFLSREAIHYLQQISIDPVSLGAAPVRFVRLSSGSRVAEAALPFPALSLSRRVLDAALLARAAEVGCEVLLGAEVDALTADDNIWRVQLSTESVRAKTVFLANGKHDLRGWARQRGRQSDLIGFKLHYRLEPAQTAALRTCVELFLFPGGYGGLSLVEEQKANLCFVVRRSAVRGAGSWSAIFTTILNDNRHMHRRLHGAVPLYSKPLAIAPIPYGYLATQPCRLWRLGDQAAVIPSFTGDGMSIALHSATLAAQMYMSGHSPDEYTRELSAQLRTPLRIATRISQMMVANLSRKVAPVWLPFLSRAMPWIAASTRVPEPALVDPDCLLSRA